MLAEPASPSCDCAPAGPSHVQNHFKGRHCLSWNVWHEANSSPGQPCQDSFLPLESPFAVQLPSGPLEHCSTEAQPSLSVFPIIPGMCSLQSGPSCLGVLGGARPAGKGRRRAEVLRVALRWGRSRIPGWGLQCNAGPQIGRVHPQDPRLWLACLLFSDDKIWGISRVC